MSRFDDTPILQEIEESRSSSGKVLPSDCYTLAWTKEKNKGPFHQDPVVIFKPHTKFKEKPIILMPLKPKLDDGKFESKLMPVSVKQEPKSELLTADALNKFEANARNILLWTKNARTALAQFNLGVSGSDSSQITTLATDCTKGKIYASVEELRQSTLGTVVPRNMPQLVEPWQDVKNKTRHTVNSFPLIAKALTDKNIPEANNLLQGVEQDLNQALRDGFDRASAVADRLPKLQAQDAAESCLSPEDQKKATQIKILGAYQTLSYFVSTLESQVRTLSDRVYGEMEESDWVRLERNYRTFQRDMNGLKREFNADTMKKLEESNELTTEQKQVLTQFRQSLEQVLPALESLQTTSPIQGQKFTPVYQGLAERMSEIQHLSWQISGKASYLAMELSLKKEIPTAPEWKRPLLAQKLDLVQHLDDSGKDRAATVSIIRDLDNEIHARTLQETTPESLRPLLTQYNSYNKLARISDVIDEISSDARDIMFLTGGLYSRQEAAVRLQAESSSILSRISHFKSMVGTVEQQQQLSSLVNSTDLTPEQSTQTKEFYSSVQALMPQIEQLENAVRVGPDKHFWKYSKTVREQMETAHDLGFKILLQSFDLHGKLDKALQGKK